MAFFDRFRDKEEARSADVARDRLKVIVSHERRQRTAPDYLPATASATPPSPPPGPPPPQ